MTKKKIIYSNVFIVDVFRFAALIFFFFPIFSSDVYDFSLSIQWVDTLFTWERTHTRKHTQGHTHTGAHTHTFSRIEKAQLHSEFFTFDLHLGILGKKI